MYKTTQRDVIINYLKENADRHITVDDILFYLKSHDIAVGKTTVYRYFGVLEKQGLLRKFENMDGKSACYQYVNEHESGNHYHFVCESCNELFHIECNFLDEIQAHIFSDHTFKINSVKTVFQGTCKNCITKH